MAKSQKSKANQQAQNTNQQIIVALVLAAILGIGGFIWFGGGGAPVAEGLGGVISPADYVSTFAESEQDHVLIDVRTPGEFAEGYIDGAVNIPLDQLASRLSEVPQDTPVVLYCRSGNRSNQAAGVLAQAGYTNVYDLGGVLGWQAAGLPLQ